MTYSAFIHQLQVKHIQLDRKTLAYLAEQVPQAFSDIVKFVSK